MTTLGLADTGALAARVAALEAAHMQPLNEFVLELRNTGRIVPWFDPSDGGTGARLLILLESPTRRGSDPRFVSRDNVTPTQANLRRFLAEAGIPRRDTILWNVVPWVMNPDGRRNRAPNCAEIRDGLTRLPSLLSLLQKLDIVVASGRVAAQAGPVIADSRPDADFYEMPHPSPVYVNTSPHIAARIRTVLNEASKSLNR
jgi:uracil-DNA glycosylase